MKTASATIKGFEVMRIIRRGHCPTCKPRVQDEVRQMDKLLEVFSVAASSINEQANSFTGVSAIEPPDCLV